VRNHAIHPYSAPIISACFLLVALVFPSDIWGRYLGEENYAYMNFGLLFFTLTSLSCLYFGIFLGKSFISVSRYRNAASCPYEYNLLLIPVIGFSILVSFTFLLHLYLNYDGLVFWVFQGQGQKVKELVASDQIDYISILPFLVFVVLWGWYRYFEGVRFGACSRKASLFLLLVLTLLVIHLLIVLVARYVLMPLVVGLFLVILQFRVYSGLRSELHFRYSLRYGLVFVLLILLLFSLIAISRGNKNFDAVLAMVLGYGPASFNRLALVLSGEMVLPYTDTGVYVIPEPLFGFLRTLSGRELIDPFSVWLSEFEAISVSSLNSTMIWVTQFGYVFGSLRNWSFLYLVLYGFALGCTYRLFLKGSLMGVVSYPFLFFSVFFLFGSVYFNGYFLYFFIFCLLIFFWEKLLFRFIVEIGHE
jgi:hypothetical protein